MTNLRAMFTPQAVQSYRATAEGQASSAKKEAEQLRERSSVSQTAQQQLLVQLAEAEEALSSSRLTSTRLLQEGRRLEAQVCVWHCSRGWCQHVSKRYALVTIWTHVVTHASDVAKLSQANSAAATWC